MPSRMRFALNFSGSEVLNQRRLAEEHLRDLADDDYSARARLLAILTAASAASDEAATRETAAEAFDAAGRTADPVATAWALLALCISDLSCAATELRLARTQDIFNIAQKSSETEFLGATYLLHLAALAELGKITELDHALSPLGPILSRFPELTHERHTAWFRCLQATLSGNVTQAEAWADHAYVLAQDSGDPDGEAVYTGQIGVLRWVQGRATELEPTFLLARQNAPHEPVWAASLAWVWLRQGRRQAARALLSSLPHIDSLPVDRNWLSTACILAEVAADLGDRVACEALYAALLVFRDRLVTIGLGVTCWGTVERPLGLIAAATGDLELAIAHYRQAGDVAARAGAQPWLTQIQWELARLLAARSQPGDTSEALSLAREAAITGRALSLPWLEGEGSRTLAKIRQAASRPPVSTERPEPNARRPRVQLFDSFSVTSINGTGARWQSRKARHLLKILLARRGAALSREALMHLLWPGLPAARLTNRFSVATTAVRRALDPLGEMPRDAFIDHRDGLVRLRIETVDIDVEEFLAAAATALSSEGSPAQRLASLEEAMSLYKGEPLQEVQDELWAAEFRRETHVAFFAVAHAYAELCRELEDHLARLETYGRILALDEFDQRAHEGVIDALVALRSHGRASAARQYYADRMKVLGVPLPTC